MSTIIVSPDGIARFATTEPSVSITTAACACFVAAFVAVKALLMAGVL